MKHDRLDLSPGDGDDILGAAFRAVREAHDGTNEEADATLHRALFRTRGTVRRQRLARWVVLPAAAVLVASTAWAGVTGRLAPAVRTVLEAVHTERPPPPPRMPTVALPAPPAPDKPVEPAPVTPDEPGPVVAAPPEPAPASPPVALTPSPFVRSPSAPATTPALAPRPATATVATAAERPAPVAPAAPPAPSASAPDPHAALFAEAHQIHFAERDPGRALAAWDRYLAVDPQGRFAPEARYNRALALVRVGRKTEAQQELAAFANGMYGDYRRAEAKALLDALARPD